MSLYDPDAPENETLEQCMERTRAEWARSPLYRLLSARLVKKRGRFGMKCGCGWKLEYEGRYKDAVRIQNKHRSWCLFVLRGEGPWRREDEA